MTERTYLCLGGPKDGGTITLGDNRAQFAVYDTASWPAAIIDGSPFVPAQPPVLYAIREVAMFGRRLRLAVLSTLTDAEMDDAAWRHLVLGERIVQDLQALPTTRTKAWDRGWDSISLADAVNVVQDRVAAIEGTKRA